MGIKTAQVQVEFFVIKEGDIFAAYCPSLNLATQGDTYDEACKAFQEALEIFIEEVVKSGTLDAVLQEHGWRKIDKKWVVPTVVGSATTNVAIPA